MLELIDESGIKECPDELAVTTVAAYLAAHSELVEHWLRWSENKRVSSGWFFTRAPASYEVGFRPKGEVFHVTQPELACAEFVTREVQAMLTISRAGNPFASFLSALYRGARKLAQR